MRHANPALPYPIYCLEGTRNCPPESCSDMKEFAEYLKTTGDVSQFDHAAINRKFGVRGLIELPKQEPKPVRSRPASQANSLARLGELMRQAMESAQ